MWCPNLSLILHFLDTSRCSIANKKNSTITLIKRSIKFKYRALTLRHLESGSNRQTLGCNSTDQMTLLFFLTAWNSTLVDKQQEGKDDSRSLFARRLMPQCLEAPPVLYFVKLCESFSTSILFVILFCAFQECFHTSYALVELQHNFYSWNSILY